MQALPPPVEVINPHGASDYVLTCEHASNFIPESYHRLGLPQAELHRHIAWDIGAAEVARALAVLIDAPLILSGYSRLLIDCNRPLGSPTSIPVISETTDIPGNRVVSSREADSRAAEFYWPFQHAVSRHLEWRQETRRKAIILGIHSFTPVYRGKARPWHVGVLFRKSETFGKGLVAALSTPGVNAAANEPYTIDDDSDCTVPVHGEGRGLDAVLVEIRQDLIDTAEGARAWALRLRDALRR